MPRTQNYGQAQQHRHQEFIRFLNTVEAAVPAGKLIHAIADNYATHKHPKVREWLMRHSALDLPLHPHRRIVAQCRRRLFRQADQAEAQTWRLPSIVELQAAIKRFWLKPTQTRAPSAGPGIQTKSSQPSKEDTKC